MFLTKMYPYYKRDLLCAIGREVMIVDPSCHYKGYVGTVKAYNFRDDTLTICVHSAAEQSSISIHLSKVQPMPQEC